jgi:hypothetical protein
MARKYDRDNKRRRPQARSKFIKAGPSGYAGQPNLAKEKAQISLDSLVLIETFQ